MGRSEEIKSFKMKNEMVYDYLKKCILSGALKPAEKIVIREISKKLNVSDIPVREAIRKLESQGFVGIIPHVGARVIEIKRDEIEEIYVIRSELESLATRLASKYINDREFYKLEKMLDECEKSIQSGSYERIGELNKHFHLEIYSCSPYKRLFNMISDLWASSSMMRSVFVLSPVRARQSLKEHRQILEALKNGNGKLAGKLVRRQKIAAWDAVSKFIKE